MVEIESSVSSNCYNYCKALTIFSLETCISDDVIN